MRVVIKKIIKWIEEREAIVLILLLVAVLRMPSLFEPHWYGDEGIYLVLGQALRKGLVWYKEIHDNKPPLLYLLAAISGNVMWFRFMLMITSLINVVAIYKLLSRFVAKNTWAVNLGTLLFAVLSSIPMIEGNIANAEIFMILPVTLAVLLLTNKTTGIKEYFGAGLLMSLAFLFKVPSAFDVFAVGLWLVWKFFDEKNKGLEFRKILVYVGGFLLPVVLTIVYYAAVGAFDQYMTAAFLQNIGYLSSWRTGTITKSGASSQSGLLGRAVIWMVATLVCAFLTRKEKMIKRLALIWFLGALFGALLSERPYPHYLIQLLPPGAILVAMAIERQTKYWFVGFVVCLSLTLFAIQRYKFYFYPNISYYKNFVTYKSGMMSERDYRNTFGEKIDRNYAIAKYIKLRTERHETMFVWGDEPFIYALANRLPPGRFTVAYHVVDFDGKEETLKALMEKQTRYVVTLESEKREYKEFFKYLLSNYTPIYHQEGAVIWRLMEKNK